MLNKQDKDIVYRLIYVAITRASKEIKILMPSYHIERLESIGKLLQDTFPDDINEILAGV